MILGGLSCYQILLEVINEPFNFRNALGCSDFNFWIGVNDQFFALDCVAVDPLVVIVVALLNVFQRNGLALASSSRDALHARLGVRPNVDESSNRQVPHKLVKPHVVNGVFIVRNVAAVVEHFGEDIAVGVHAALSDDDATAPGIVANRLAQ